MANRGYLKYINSPMWRAKRIRYWASVGGQACQACGRKKNLHVHHKTYERFGKELLTDLVGLCDTCHRAVHSLHRAKGGNLAFWTDRHVYLERRKRK